MDPALGQTAPGGQCVISIGSTLALTLRQSSYDLGLGKSCIRSAAGICHESKCLLSLMLADADRDDPGDVNPPGHLALEEGLQCREAGLRAQLEGHADTRTAPVKAQHHPRSFRRAPIAG